MPIAVSYFIPVNPAFCEGLHTYHEWFVMVVQTHAGILCLLRVYALYGRSRHILGLLLFLGTGSIVTAMASLFSSRKGGGETIPVISPFVGCAQYTPHIGGRYAAIAWTGVLVFDGMVFFLTLYKAFTIGRGVKLLYVIVRDGTMYFSALSFMNLGNIMTLRFAPPLLKTSTTTFTNVLSTTLVTRLVLNLRERAVKQLPTTVETVGRFEAALPVARQPLSVTSVRNPSFFRQNRSTVTATREMVTSVVIGDSRSQQFRSMDVIEYERRSQATLSVGRQQPATSSYARSLSSIRQNISMGETVSVGTTTESRRGADAIGHETERKFQTAWLVSRQPMTSAFIPTRSPSSVRPNRSTGETTSVGPAGASNSRLQSADDATREEGSQSK